MALLAPPSPGRRGGGGGVAPCMSRAHFFKKALISFKGRDGFASPQSASLSLASSRRRGPTHFFCDAMPPWPWPPVSPQDAPHLFARARRRPGLPWPPERASCRIPSPRTHLPHDAPSPPIWGRLVSLTLVPAPWPRLHAPTPHPPHAPTGDPQGAGKGTSDGPGPVCCVHGGRRPTETRERGGHNNQQQPQNPKPWTPPA